MERNYIIVNFPQEAARSAFSLMYVLESKLLPKAVMYLHATITDEEQ